MSNELPPDGSDASHAGRDESAANEQPVVAEWVDAPIEAEAIEAEVIEATTVGDSPRRGLSLSGIVSWVVVAAMTCFIVSMVAIAQTQASATVGGEVSRADLVQTELAGKMLVGSMHWERVVKSWDGSNAGADSADEAASSLEAGDLADEERLEQIRPTLEKLNDGTYEQRLAHAILTREILGPETASQNLLALAKKVTSSELVLSESQTQMRDAVTRSVQAAVANGADGSGADAESNPNDVEEISDEEATLLAERLGWIGRLAALPEGAADLKAREALLSEAVTTTLVYTLISAVVIGAVVIGFILFFIAIRRSWNGTIRGRFQNGPGDHNIYIETFALWVVYFFGFSMFASLVPGLADLSPLLLSPLVMFSSLWVLIWPLVRGRSLSEVGADLGLSTPRPLTQLMFAPVGYLTTIPLVCLSLAVVFGILMPFTQTTEPPAFSRGDTISHPIVEYVAESGTSILWLVLLTACVAAPIVEEVMFRGVLYRHLRDASAHWRRGASVAFSALLNAFVFAAIHPQGIMLIPVLGSLAVGFSLMREWRESLYPCMAMHAIHNGLTTCLMFTIL